MLAAAFVQRDGQRHVRDGADHGEQRVVAQRVPQHPPCGRAVDEQELDVVEADPVAVENAFGEVVVFERQQQAEHRDVAEHDNQRHPRQNEQQQCLVFPNVLKKRFDLCGRAHELSPFLFV